MTLSMLFSEKTIVDIRGYYNDLNVFRLQESYCSGILFAFLSHCDISNNICLHSQSYK